MKKKLSSISTETNGTSKIAEIPSSVFPAGWQFYRSSRQVGEWLTRTPLGFKLLFWCCGQRWFQQQFSSDLAILKRFLAETQPFNVKPDTIIQLSLSGHIWYAWWYERLRRCSKDKLEDQVLVSGLSNLQTPQQLGQQVLLVSYHSICAPVIDTFLQLHEFQNYLFIGMTNAILPARGEEATKYKVMTEHLRQLMASKKMLQSGGIVVMLPDGSRGKEENLKAFYNRQRPFRSSFAELAVMTDAAVVPIAPSIKMNGKFHLEIMKPFDDMSSANDHSERIDYLINQYIDFLRDQWKMPWNLSLRYLQKHLALPAVENGK